MASNSPKIYRLVVHAIVCLGALATLASIGWSAQGLKGLLNVITFWALIPYAVLATICSCLHDRYYLIALQMFSAAAVGFALWIYLGIYLHPDAQDGLVYVFVPLYQMAASLVFGVILGVVHGVRRRWQQG